MKKILLLAFVSVLLSVAMMGRFVRPVEADATIYIRADGRVEGTTQISTSDNVTYIFTSNIDGSIVVERDNIVVDGAGQTVQGNGSGRGIYLSGRSNVTIKNMEIKGFMVGIFLFSSSNNSNIFGTNITNNGNYGVYLSSSSDNNLSRNSIANNTYGLFLYRSTGNSIYGNNLTNNGYAIWIVQSSSNLLCDNLLENNQYGFYVSGFEVSQYMHSIDASNLVDGKPVYYVVSQQNLAINSLTHPRIGFLALVTSINVTVEDLTLTKNYQGLLLAYTNNSKIANNHIVNNAYGIWLHSSTNNKIYHNSIMNNTWQTFIYGVESTNAWDYGHPSGGNYWSDYTGTDSDRDGIGDTPYDIPCGNQDIYPLMGMFSDFNATPEHHFQTISNSSISDFQFNGTAIRFNVSGGGGTTGFCRILIPTALMGTPYKVYINGTEVAYILSSFSNSAHSYLYFTYTHSTKEVTIVPEFPSWMPKLLIFIILTAATTIASRRLLKTQQHFVFE